MRRELSFAVLQQPDVRQRAQQAARTFQTQVFSSTGPVDCYRLASGAVRTRFNRNSQPEIDLLVAIIMSETWRAAEEDIEEIKRELEQSNRMKKKLRDAIEHLAPRVRMAREEPQGMNPRPYPDRVQVQRTSGRLQAQTAKTRNLGISYAKTPAYQTFNLSGGNETATIQGLKSLLDDLKGKLDDMNEMSEMTSLRLQMTMDRRSKFISTLSQVMKKISTTQDLLAQNIK